MKYIICKYIVLSQDELGKKKHVCLWCKLPEEIKGIINIGFTNSLKNEKFFATHLRLETLHFKNLTKKVIKLHSVSYSDHSYHIKVRL